MGRNKSDLIIFVGKRLLQLVPVLFGVITITFFFTHVAVPDPCASWTKARTPAAVQQCRITFGFDKPLLIQYWTYLGNLVGGNWGENSVREQVLPAILRAFPETLELVTTSIVLMIIVGIPLGVVAANGAGRWRDHLVRTFYLSGWATPTYLGAVVLAVVVGPALEELTERFRVVGITDLFTHGNRSY